MHSIAPPLTASCLPPSLRQSPVLAQDYAPSRLHRLRLLLKRRWRSLCKLALLAILLCVAGLLLLHNEYAGRAAQMDIASYSSFAERNEIFDSNGRFVRALPGEITRKCIAPDELPQVLIDCILVMEDQHFYEHGGVNWWGVARAAWHDVATLSLAQGGSSLTQQSIKLWLARTKESAVDKVKRKLLEVELADRIENANSKPAILANYFNRIDFGAGLQGVGAASEGFFGKQVKDLNLIEAATLVAIVRGPDVYSPVKHPDRTIARRNLVLRRLTETGKLSSTQANALAAQPMSLALEAWRKRQAPDQLSTLVKTELARALPKDVVDKGGLRIELTLNSDWTTQVSNAAEAHLRSLEARRGRSKDLLQTAVIVLDNRTGAICAMVNGRPSAPRQFDFVTRALRDPGSAIKPFVYANAFMQGASPDDLIESGPIGFSELSFGNPHWSPGDMHECAGLMPIRTAIEQSINTVAVRVGDRNGIDNFISLVTKLGIGSSKTVPRWPTSFLGAFGVRPIDLASAYTVFVNGGPQCAPPHIIKQVQDSAGVAIYISPTGMRPGCEPSAATLTARCLSGVFTRGTAKSAGSMGLRVKAIGKTGTTNECKDYWFAGSTQHFTTVVWVGFEHPRHVLNAPAAVGALPLWVRTVNITESSSQ